MKKLITLFCLLAMLASCSGNGKEETQNNNITKDSLVGIWDCKAFNGVDTVNAWFIFSTKEQSYTLLFAENGPNFLGSIMKMEWEISGDHLLFWSDENEKDLSRCEIVYFKNDTMKCDIKGRSQAVFTRIHL